MKNTDLCIVIPCYNEEEVLPETIRQLTAVMDRLKASGKITAGRLLFVDDGSKDRTWELIATHAQPGSWVGGLKLAHNEGHQGALMAGLEWAAAHSDAAVSIDADLQDDVNAIEEMVDRFNEGADIVYGVRKARETDTWFKKNTALAFYRLIRTMGGDVVYNHADFRLMSRRALQALLAYPERNLFTIPGWTSLLVSVWFIGGIIMIAIGVTGVYIGKIYKEVKQRPRYFIDRTANLESK